MVSHKSIEKVISNIIVELDNEQVNYQTIYNKIYGHSDQNAKSSYQLMINLCKRIRQEILNTKD